MTKFPKSLLDTFREISRSENMIRDALLPQQMIRDALLPQQMIRDALRSQEILEFHRLSSASEERWRSVVVEQFRTLSAFREQISVFETLNKQSLDIINKQHHSLNLINEKYRSLEVFNKKYFLSNNVHDLTEKLSSNANLSIKMLYPFATEAAKFFHSCERLRLSAQTLTQLHLSDPTPELTKALDLLTTYKISTPTNPVDAITAWVEEKDDYTEEFIPSTTELTTYRHKWKGIVTSPLLPTWIAAIVSLANLVQSCENGDVTPEVFNRMGEETRVLVKTQTEETNNQRQSLENKFIEVEAEDRPGFLYFTLEETRRTVQEELPDNNTKDLDE